MSEKNLAHINQRFLGIKKATEKTDLSRSTIYRLERAGHFPKRRQISPGRIGWLEDEIDAFLRSRALTPIAGGGR